MTNLTVLQEFKNSTEDVFATITDDEQMQCVVNCWHGAFGTKENYQMVLKAVVALAINRKYRKWIADLRQMKGSYDRSSDWMRQELMPKAARGGLKYGAIVAPKDIFAKLSTKDLLIKMENPNIRAFATYEEARAWLETV